MQAGRWQVYCLTVWLWGIVYAMPTNPAVSKLREAIASRGLTQVDVAKLLGVTQAAISKVLTGDRRPSPDLARGLVRVSGASVEWWELIPPRKRSRRAA